MSSLQKGLLLAVVQLALVASLGAKFALDRARLPRVWAQTVAYDPDLPIRGRYLSVRLRVRAERVYGSAQLPQGNGRRFWEPGRDITLSAESGELVANSAPGPTGLRVTRWKNRAEEVSVLEEPVAFFLPEHAADPSRRAAGEELWVEVTVPKKGPPRPIRLGVKRGEQITPLEIR